MESAREEFNADRRDCGRYVGGEEGVTDIGVHYTRGGPRRRAQTINVHIIIYYRYHIYIYNTSIRCIYTHVFPYIFLYIYYMSAQNKLRYVSRSSTS